MVSCLARENPIDFDTRVICAIRFQQEDPFYQMFSASRHFKLLLYRARA
jgi:hypothetical protein